MVEKIVTPQQYARIISGAVFQKEKSYKLRCVWAVPDFEDYFSGHINPYLGRYAKCQWTQLQIIFEAVDDPEERQKYPNGVKVSYRAFCSDSVKILKRLPVADEPTTSTTCELTDAQVDEEVQEAIRDGHYPGVMWDEHVMQQDRGNFCIGT